MHRLTVTLVIVIGFAAVAYSGNIADLVSSLPVSSRKEILKQYYREELNDARDDRDLAEFVFPLEQDLSTDPQDVTGYVVRSKHVLFGLPKLTDERYGSRDVSLLFREGFVVAFSQQLGSPIWVSQRWTRDNLSDKVDTPSLARDFVDDGEIPPEFHRGDSFKGNTTFLDRGHMAKHSMNRAWGFDASVAGCLMTNITPQHKDINQQPGGWHRLEESVEEIVSDSIVIDVVWTISGAVFQDQDNPPGESPTEDLENAARITDGFAVPYATYKIVAWFDENGGIQTRGYLFEQPYTHTPPGLPQFTIPDQSLPLNEYLVPIRDIEKRTGIDFFPRLVDDVQTVIETAEFDNQWGEEE